MAGPFVISAKFTLDGGSVSPAANDIRGEFQSIEKAAVNAATAMQRMADQRQRTAAASASGIGSALNPRDDFNSAGRGEDIAAYGRALDEMRARYNPLFAAEQRHQAQLAGIRRAHQLGAISSREMSQAIAREGTAYSQAVAAINGNTEAKQRNAAVGAAAARGNGEGQFATANIAAQFQDIAVTSAMGMSPLQIALQQGTQISAAFGTMGAAGAVRTLGAAFLSIISPVSLVTIGLVAGAAAAIQFFSGLAQGAESASDALVRHNDELDELLAGYDDVRAAAQDAFDAAMRRPEGVVSSDLRASLREQEEAQIQLQRRIEANREALAEQAENLRQSQQIGLAGGEDGSALDAAIQQIELMRQLAVDTGSSREELEAATVAAREFYNTADDTSLEQMADQVYLLAIELLGLRAQADSATAALEAMPDNIVVRLTLQAEGFGDAMTALKDVVPDQRSRFDQMRAANETAVQQASIRALSIGALDAAVSQYESNLATIDQLEAEHEAKVASRSSKQVSAYERQIKAIKDRTAAQQLETNVIGLGTYASERARMVLELENAAREDAIGLSAGRAAQIQQEASAYALAAAAQEKAVELQRAATEQYEFGRNTFRSFFADLKSGLKDGQDGWTALGNAGANALDRIADRALGMMADGIFDMIFGAVMGGITGGFGGGMGSGLGGVSGITGSSGGFFPGFADGGWTGGVAGQVRGAVHGEEFVVRAGPAAQHRQLLETINAGGSPGGGHQVTLAPVYNYNGSSFTEAQARRLNAENNRDLMAMLPDALADARYRAVRSA